MKHIIYFLFIIGLTISCSETEETENEVTSVVITPFEKVLSETKTILPLLKNAYLVMDSSSINTYTSSFNLTQNGNTYRSETNFGGIKLKRVFTCSNDLINKIHFDFYYDSLNVDLEKNTNELLDFLKLELGATPSSSSNSSMKIYTWDTYKNIIDFEIFSNGYTITLRKNDKNKTTTPLVIKDEKLAEHFELSKLLVDYIYSDSIVIGHSKKETISSLFDVNFKEKANTLAFNQTYSENILLSASFLFQGDKLSGLYFDFMYTDTSTTEILADAKVVKSLVNAIYGLPNEVGTVAISTSYKWDTTPIKLDVFGDGYSIVLEKEEL